MPFISSPTLATDARVWRYMEFAQLVSIIADGQLFCPTIKTMRADDPWEGMWSQAFLDRQYQICLGIEDVPKTPEQKARANAEVTALIQNQTQAWPRFAVSCWRQHDHESDAMWKAYIEGDFGIAIETTFGLLEEAFRPCGQGEDRLVFLRPVSYGGRESNDVYAPFFQKRLDFDTDAEIRVVIDERHDICGPGIYVDVDLARFVRRVWISPKGSKQAWFIKAVQKVLCKYGLEHIEVKASELMSEPRVGPSTT